MRIIASWTALAILAGCTSSVAQESQAAPRNDTGEAETTGVQSSRDFDLSGFNHVELTTPDNVEIVQGSAFSIRAVGDSVRLEELELRVERGELRIGYRDDHNRNWRRQHRRPLNISITMPVLNGVAIAGSGDMSVGRFAVQAFDASIAGSGDIVIESLQTDRAELEIAGSGDIRIAGTSADIEIEIAGSGDINAANFRAQRLDVDIAGSGDVDAYVTERVHASIVGSGHVNARGGAQCRSSTVGSGRLRCS